VSKSWSVFGFGGEIYRKYVLNSLNVTCYDDIVLKHVITRKKRQKRILCEI